MDTASQDKRNLNEKKNWYSNYGSIKNDVEEVSGDILAQNKDISIGEISERSSFQDYIS